MLDLHDALAHVINNDGSDLHLKVPARPMARFQGQLEPLPHYQESLTPAETERVLREMLAEGEYYGVQTFDQALLHHVQAGRVAMEDAGRPPRAPTTSSCWWRETGAPRLR
jgi:Tfp pilus assembly pilus retraction ATPase PilT